MSPPCRCVGEVGEQAVSSPLEAKHWLHVCLKVAKYLHIAKPYQ